MTLLTRWDPFREMLDLRRRMDRVFDDSFRSAEQWDGGNEQSSLALDVSEDQDNYIVKASIPGVNPEDIDITMNNDVLTISGESKSEDEREEGQWHLRERRYGRFSRSLRLPATINSEKIEATCENGVLKLQLPKAEETKPRRIAVRGSNGDRQTIEGESQTVNGTKQPAQPQTAKS